LSSQFLHISQKDARYPLTEKELYNWDRQKFDWTKIKTKVQETEGLKRNHLVYMTRDGHAGEGLVQKLLVLESRRPGVFKVREANFFFRIFRN
jgi:hypothetical protein